MCSLESYAFGDTSSKYHLFGHSTMTNVPDVNKVCI